VAAKFQIERWMDGPAGAEKRRRYSGGQRDGGETIPPLCALTRGVRAQQRREGGATNLIDVPEDFVRDMGELSKDEQALVIKVLVLCSILDGRLRGRERKLYEQVLAASDESFANNQQRIKQLATRYRTMVPVTLADFDEIIELSALAITPKYYCNECLSTCALVMAC
jgi:hypothetical protein